MTKKKKIIGVDPLDWMEQDEIKEYKNMENEESHNVEMPQQDIEEKVIEENEVNSVFMVDLGEQFDIRNIEQTQNDIKEADMNHVEQIQFIGANIKKIDAAALQYLAAYIKHANKNLIPVTLINANELLKSNIALLGLSTILLGQE